MYDIGNFPHVKSVITKAILTWPLRTDFFLQPGQFCLPTLTQPPSIQLSSAHNSGPKKYVTWGPVLMSVGAKASEAAPEQSVSGNSQRKGKGGGNLGLSWPCFPNVMLTERRISYILMSFYF